MVAYTTSDDGVVVRDALRRRDELPERGSTYDGLLMSGPAGTHHPDADKYRSGNAILTLREHRDGTHVIDYSLHELKGSSDAEPVQTAHRLAPTRHTTAS